MTDNKNVFEIGLAMAGAISAGAYSAGVVDFLFQALDEWELYKRDHPNDVPNHSVCIRAAAGASAGSITAALAAVAVAGGLRPEKVKDLKEGEQPYRYVLPALYKAWVTMPDMASPHPGKPDLLATDELKDGVSPQSILNAHILDALTDEALELPAPAAGVLPGPAYGGDPLPYFAERLHLYLTLSNLRGVPYVVGFEGSGTTHGHYMMSHGDRAHYTLEGIGTHRGENAWLSKDNCDPLKITTVPRADKARDSTYEDWQRYGRTALASAAFPLGLAARHIESNVDKYEARAWPSLPGVGIGFPPRWPDSWPKKDYKFGFMSVDGGLIDNEPFEYARRAIMRDDEDDKPDESCVRGAVLMIDPFPEPPAFSLREMAEASMFEVARAVFPMLKNQVRFKPDALATALNNDNYSRWMIAPSRTVRRSPDEKEKKDEKAVKNERYAIATGVLGGFGGFLDESFRAHDYQLGRRNCQKFLRDIFSVGEGHPFVNDWPLGVPERFSKLDGASNKNYWPVIPLVGTAELEVPAPDWPRIDYERLAKIEERIRLRASYVVPRLVTSKTRHKVVNGAAKLLWRWPGQSRVLKVVHRTIEADLIRRDQLKTETPYSTDAREVLAELNAPGYDYRTVDGLDKAIYLNKEQICAALDELKRTPNLLWTGKVNGQECCVLIKRRLKWWKRYDPLRGEPRIG
jgi:hypothetical protein